MNFIKPALNTACTDLSTFFYSFANKFDNFDYEFYTHSTKYAYVIVFAKYIVIWHEYCMLISRRKHSAPESGIFAPRATTRIGFPSFERERDSNLNPVQ